MSDNVNSDMAFNTIQPDPAPVIETHMLRVPISGPMTVSSREVQFAQDYRNGDETGPEYVVLSTNGLTQAEAVAAALAILRRYQPAALRSPFMADRGQPS